MPPRALCQSHQHKCTDVCPRHVWQLLLLRDKYHRVITEAFADDKQFYNALNQSFEHFVNLNSHSPEYISLFVDEQLRKGMKGTSEEEVEAMASGDTDVLVSHPGLNRYLDLLMGECLTATDGALDHPQASHSGGHLADFVE